jgi:hypothetical protein
MRHNAEITESPSTSGQRHGDAFRVAVAPPSSTTPAATISPDIDNHVWWFGGCFAPSW